MKEKFEQDKAKTGALGSAPGQVDRDWEQKIAVAREARELGSELRKNQPIAQPLRYKVHERPESAF